MIESLGHLIEENQDALNRLGVSHPVIDTILSRVKVELGWPGKLSGAGQGGCCLFLCPPQSTAHPIQNYCHQLETLFQNQYPVYPLVLHPSTRLS
jgi:mevalonate kinase